MQRITESNLEALALRINKATGSPETYMTDGKCNIGHYHISYAYGGAALHRLTSAGGGVNCPIGGGHMPKRELWDRMQAYLSGLNDAKGE